MGTWFMLYFCNSNSFSMDLFLFFYDYLMVIVSGILSLVLFMLIFELKNSYFWAPSYALSLIEVAWTLLPMLVTLFMLAPSLASLYYCDYYLLSDLSCKVVGNQWYWVYEFSELGTTPIESYMLKSNASGVFRLLDTDNSLTLPYGKIIRLLVTSGDVIHSWALPSLGVKMDAVPGRVNQSFFKGELGGIFYGQCSEICGANHSFMPIKLEILSPKIFSLGA